MAFADDFSNPDEGEGKGLEKYERIVENAADEILKGNYKNAYSLLAKETDLETSTEKDFRDQSILLNQLAEEKSFEEVPKYLSALVYDSGAMYDPEEAEEIVKSFAEELNSLYDDK